MRTAKEATKDIIQRVAWILQASNGDCFVGIGEWMSIQMLIQKAYDDGVKEGIAAMTLASQELRSNSDGSD
jgi:hypothetical protein